MMHATTVTTPTVDIAFAFAIVVCTMAKVFNDGVWYALHTLSAGVELLRRQGKVMHWVVTPAAT